jgi:hypothetical protein
MGWPSETRHTISRTKWVEIIEAHFKRDLSDEERVQANRIFDDGKNAGDAILTILRSGAINDQRKADS